MSAQRILAALLLLLGASAVAIAAGVYLAGPAQVANGAAGLLGYFGLGGGAVTGLSSADIDNEMRFYAVFWFAYGVAAISVARRLPTSIKTARLLLALFFAGGAGRALSIASVGAPHPVFIALMWIELLAPTALLLLSWCIKPAPITNQEPLNKRR